MTDEDDTDDVVAVCEAPTQADTFPFEPGLFDGMPSTQYHAIEALSSSGVAKLLHSPKHYRLFRDSFNAPTPQMQFGTAVHCGVLEPALFATAVVAAPYVNKRTKDGKAQWLAFCTANAGRIVLAAADYARVLRCVEAVRNHPAASQLLAGATVERSLFWNDGQYNVPCKARLDAWNAGILVDLKTTADASRDEFARSIATYGYHVQAAHYTNAAEAVLNESPEAYVIVAVESEPPHEVACYRLPANALLAGAHRLAKALATYADVMASGVWSGYPATIDTIQLPRYALRFD
jgi:hypothetical protein